MIHTPECTLASCWGLRVTDSLNNMPDLIRSFFTVHYSTRLDLCHSLWLPKLHHCLCHFLSSCANAVLEREWLSVTCCSLHVCNKILPLCPMFWWFLFYRLLLNISMTAMTIDPKFIWWAVNCPTRWPWWTFQSWTAPKPPQDTKSALPEKKSKNSWSCVKTLRILYLLEIVH